jgi:uncharacterized protein (TIGR03085 family)
MTTPARAERLALCDLFLDIGPDAPTLAGDWTTRDLAAHLVVRERRPDAGPGIVTAFLHDYSERVRIAERERPWTDLVERVRRGPPLWNPMRIEPVDALVNTVEFFVHHEDVRRATTGWEARTLDAPLEDALASSITRAGSVLARKATVGLELAADDRDPVRLHKGSPVVTISGPIGECVLYVYGRKDVAAVTLDGPPDAVTSVAATPFGL